MLTSHQQAVIIGGFWKPVSHPSAANRRRRNGEELRRLSMRGAERQVARAVYRGPTGLAIVLGGWARLSRRRDLGEHTLT